MMNLLQSFHGKPLWLPTGNGHVVTNGNAFRDSLSTVDPKCGRQWFLDAVNPELFPSQNQAFNVSISSKAETGITPEKLPIGNSLGFQLVPNQVLEEGFQSIPNNFMDRLVRSETKPAKLTKRNRSVVGKYGSHVKKEDTNKRSKNDSYAVGSSSSYVVEDSVNQADTRGSKNIFISMEQSCGKKIENVSSMDHSNGIRYASSRPTGSTFEKGTNNAVKTTHSRSKRDSKIYQDVMGALQTPVSSYSLMYEEPSVQTSKTPRKKRVNVPNGNAMLRRAQAPKSRHESLPEKNATKKEAPNRFPTNVKSLTATGMLDGVPVLYSSASREKQLRGIIKGSSYLCGCSTCNYSNELNAYEFEHHAGCKTSHPNNHIHFANWKTIHQIVQELKNTPESMLVDAIQSVTGSPINQQAFLLWTESFEAASRRKHQRVSI